MLTCAILTSLNTRYNSFCYYSHASMFCLFVFLFLSFLYSVLRYSLSSPPRIATLTAGYNGLCNLIEGNKVCVVAVINNVIIVSLSHSGE